LSTLRLLKLNYPSLRVDPKRRFLPVIIGI
jgi:hypothetical protein